MINQRIAKLREEMTRQTLDALLVSNFYNILYLTGFATLTTDEREAFVLVTKKQCYLFSDERYINKNSLIRQVQSVLSESRRTELIIRLLEPGRGLLFHLQTILKSEQAKILGFEADDLKYIEYQAIKKKLPFAILKLTERLIIRLREIKDDQEIKKVLSACVAADSCLASIIPQIKQGMSEREIVFKIEFFIKEKGYDLAFDPIVAIDKNAALPHYNTKTGEGIVSVGSIILIDLGVKSQEYLSDITRMVFFGRPKPEVVKAYEALLSAQEKTVEEVATCHYLKELDIDCRKRISEKHFPNFSHSTGHGVGLEIHEYPKVSFQSGDQKKDGQVITIEPGIYIPGRWGMRIEDTVAIRNGRAEVLTKFSKTMLIL